MKRYIGCILGFLLILFCTDYLIDRVLYYGLERYYGMRKDAELLIVSNSYLESGLDSDALEESTNLSTAKYTVSGTSFPTRCAMLAHFMSNQSNAGVKYVLFCSDIFMLTQREISMNEHVHFYPFLDAPVMREYLSQFDTPLNMVKHTLVRSTRYTMLSLYYSLRGYLNDTNSYIGDVASIELWNAKPNYSTTLNENNMKHLKEMALQYAQAGVKFILVTPPTNPQYLRHYSTTCDSIYKFYRELAGLHPNIVYLDYTELARRELFFDRAHLNNSGRTMLTTRLAEDLNYLLIK